jgi:hypothetical protein
MLCPNQHLPQCSSGDPVHGIWTLDKSEHQVLILVRKDALGANLTNGTLLEACMAGNLATEELMGALLLCGMCKFLLRLPCFVSHDLA